MAGNKIVLPSNLEAERSVLGGILLSGDTAAMVFSSLKPSDFSGVDKRNVLIYQAMSQLLKQNTPIEIASLIDELTILHTLEDAGGVTYCKELIDGVISLDDIDHYVKILKNQAVLRDFLLELNFAQEEYRDGRVNDIGEFITRESTKISEIASQRSVADFKPSNILAEEVRILLEQESRRDNKGLTGVDTGFERLNRLTHGWQKGTLNIIAARPSVGKTAFALNLAVKAAEGAHKPVAIFSAEMPGRDIMKRILSSKSHVAMDGITTGFLSQRDKERVYSAVEDVKRIPLYFDDTANIRLSDLIAKATKLKKQNPDLCLIVVDYIGLITCDIGVGPNDPRSVVVAQITKNLKKLARDLNLAVIALAQLNRSVDDNVGGVPMMSNLRESGAIEQDADTIILMYRSDYEEGKSKVNKGNNTNGPSTYGNKLQAEVDASNAKGENKDSISVVNLNLAKNRNGQPGHVILLFTKAYQTFDSPTLEMENETLKKMNMAYSRED